MYVTIYENVIRRRDVNDEKVPSVRGNNRVVEAPVVVVAMLVKMVVVVIVMTIVEVNVAVTAAAVVGVKTKVSSAIAVATHLQLLKSLCRCSKYVRES